MIEKKWNFWDNYLWTDASKAELFEDMGPVTSDVKLIQHSTIRAWYQQSNVVVVLLCCFRIWMTCYNCWNHEIWSLPGNPEGEYSAIFKCSRIVQQENNHKYKSMSIVPLHGSKEIKWRFLSGWVKVLTEIQLRCNCSYYPKWWQNKLVGLEGAIIFSHDWYWFWIIFSTNKWNESLKMYFVFKHIAFIYLRISLMIGKI